MDERIATIEDVSYMYPRSAEPVLKDISLGINKGEFLGLIGPTGAGKTTRVPLAMLDAGLTAQKIVMLEPRRLAARAHEVVDRAPAVVVPVVVLADQRAVVGDQRVGGGIARIGRDRAQLDIAFEHAVRTEVGGRHVQRCPWVASQVAGLGPVVGE